MKSHIFLDSISQKDSQLKIQPDLSNIKFHLTKEGSLGLLAYGDLALIEWRKIKVQKENSQ